MSEFKVQICRRNGIKFMSTLTKDIQLALENTYPDKYKVIRDMEFDCLNIDRLMSPDKCES